MSSTGRLFSNYPAGLDPNNTNTGSNGKYAVAELTSNTTEVPYPSVEINSPPGGAINYTTSPPSGANYDNYLIGVQSVTMDSQDRLWILDTGRAATPEGALVPATIPGGPKLIGVHVNNNTIFQTIVFPRGVVFPESYINDMRFDLRPNRTESGQGLVYITDSSTAGRNGIVIADLGTGEAWRHLDSSPTVRPDQQFVGWVQGNPSYFRAPGRPYDFIPFGADGIAISADFNTLYYTTVATRYMYAVPTLALNQRGPTSELEAQAQISNQGEKGFSDGMETDTNGYIYMGNMEQNAVTAFNPANATATIFVRDPRINWVDACTLPLPTTFSQASFADKVRAVAVATDGYLYLTVNQLHLTQSFYPGTDRRQKPYVLFRAPLPNNGTRIGC